MVDLANVSNRLPAITRQSEYRTCEEDAGAESGTGGAGDGFRRALGGLLSFWALPKPSILAVLAVCAGVGSLKAVSGVYLLTAARRSDATGKVAGVTVSF